MRQYIAIMALSLGVFSWDAQAQVCSESTVAFSESFDDRDYADEDVSSVDGWGDGAITLSAKGNSFDTTAESFGVRVFVGAAGDFDGDGYNDMVAQLLSPNCHLHFLRNRGRDTSVSPPIFRGFDDGADAGSPGFDAYRVDAPPGCSSSGPALVSGDFDGDGDDDLIYFTIVNQNREGRIEHAYYYENLGVIGGIPNFATRVDIVAQFIGGAAEPAWHWTSNPVTVVDWDGDGLDDLVMGSSYGASSRVLLFHSNGGGFDPGYALLTDSGLRGPFADFGANASSNCSGNSRGISGLAVTDFDGDADFDIVVGSLSQADLMVWRNDGSNVFTRMPDIAFPEAGVTFSLAADFDGDGDDDLMVGRDGWNCGGNGGRVYFFSNDGSGAFTRRADPVIDAGRDLDYGIAFNIDADAGGSTDLIAADGNNSGTYSQMLSSKLEIYNLAGIGQSTVLDTLSNDTNAITKVLVDISDSVPPGTGYRFYVSSNGGDDWEEIGEDQRYGQEEHTFTHFGSDLLWRVEMNAEEETLDSDELSFAPASKSTPVIYEIDFTYTYVDRRLYSRSGLALATDLEVPMVGTSDVLYGSAFYYPGFEGYLYAYNISDFEGDPGSAMLQSVTDDSDVTVLWEAGEGLQSRSGTSRVLYTARDADGDGAVDDRTLFSEANAAVLATDMAMNMADAESLITYVRAGMSHRDDWKLYDAGHSTPVFVGAPREDAEYAMYSDDNYAAFIAAESTREPRVYVGSNAGMVHAFNAITGAEEWAFIPNNLLARLKQQRDTDETGIEVYRHQFLVDGQITVRDVYDRDASRWRTVLISGQALGQGRGDNNYYFALDVTDPSDPIPLWEFTDPWSNDLQSCSGDNTVTTCETSCTETCTSSCAGPNQVFEETSVGEVFIEAEAFNGNSSVDGSYDWVAPGAACPAGASGFSGTCLVTTPDSPSVNCDITASACGAQLIYDFQTGTADRYRVHVRGFGPASDSNSVWVKVDEGAPSRVDFGNGRIGQWTWASDSTQYDLAAGDHTLTVYMRENGAFIDKLLISTGGAPSDSDYGTPQQCAERCTTGSCTETCSETTLGPDDEWPECGTGRNMRCCVGSELQVCAPVGEECPSVSTAMGETWSRPAIGRSSIAGSKRFVVAFGSGYDNINTPTDAVGRSVYLLDAIRGELLDRWDFDDIEASGANPSTIPNAVPATPELVDLDDDGVIDRLYVGDLEGRVWKVQMEADGSLGADGFVSDADWPACVVFDAGDPERDGTRTWAPIITKVAAAFPQASTGFPHLYFGTGGDDRVPSDLRYRFYAIRDDVDCDVAGDPYIARIGYEDLSIDELEWVVGDGVQTDFDTDLSPADAEGDENDRYWSDPVVLDNTFVFFASLPGSIESVNPCDNLAGGSKFFTYAARNFFDSTAGIQRRAGETIFEDPFLDAGSKIRQAVVLRKDGTSETVARMKETPDEVDPTDVFIQEFASGDAEAPDVLAITSPKAGLAATNARVVRWREISLRQ